MNDHLIKNLWISLLKKVLLTLILLAVIFYFLNNNTTILSSYNKIDWIVYILLFGYWGIMEHQILLEINRSGQDLIIISYSIFKGKKRVSFKLKGYHKS